MEQEKLRIVFMGTPDFAVESLKALVENNYHVVGVITAPDKPAGRGQKLRETPVKAYAVSQGLTVLQPPKLKAPDFVEELRALKADLQVVVAFRMLPEIVWDMPPKGSFNLHASLLPNYRGAAPLNWAVINGEKETGVSTFLLKHEIDTGNILFQEKITIGDDDDAGVVHDKLMAVGAKLVVSTVEAIGKGDIEPIDQEKLAKGQELKDAPKIFKNDCKIDWNQSATAIRNKIRGLSPYPAAWSEIKLDQENSISLKLFRTSLTETKELKVGQIDTDGKKYLKVGTGDGDLLIDELQLAGKKRLRIEDVLRGFKLKSESHFI